MKEKGLGHREAAEFLHCVSAKYLILKRTVLCFWIALQKRIDIYGDCWDFK